MTNILSKLKRNLAGSLRPNRMPFRHKMVRSAVAIVYRYHNNQCELLLIKRATREGDPWSGHMAFPGGKVQANDQSTIDAAIRETQEELGIDLNQCARFSERLPDLITRRHNQLKPMAVSSYMFKLTKEVSYTPNHEVADALWIPLNAFRDQSNHHNYQWQMGPFSFDMPSHKIEGKIVWGLTHMMIQHILRRGF